MIATVYKLHDKNGLVYFGSTRQRLYQRLAEHKYQNHIRPSSSKLLDSESMEITIMEEYQFLEGQYDKKFMETRERWYIETFECVNIKIPCRTDEERKAIRKGTAQSNLSGTKS